MQHLRSWWSLVLLALACTLAACSSSDGAAPSDTIDYELFPTTRLLDADDTRTLTEADGGVLRFATVPAKLADATTGTVLVAGQTPGAPRGLLRVVLTATPKDGGLELRTAAAPLALAFRRLHAHTSGTIDPKDTTLVPGDMGPLAFTAGGSQDFQILAFDGDGDVSTTNDQVKVDAKLGGGVRFDLKIDVDWGALEALPSTVTDCLASLAKIVVGDKPSCAIEDLLPEAKLRFEADPFLDLDVTASGAASFAFEKRDLEVAKVVLPPFPLGILVFVPQADVVATIGGGASARFEIGASAHVRGRSSVGLSSKPFSLPDVHPLDLDTPDVHATEPKVDLRAKAYAKVGVRLGLALYGVAGPYAKLSGVAQIDADPLANPCWNLHVGVEGELGVRVAADLPLLGSVTLLDWHTDPFRPFDRVVGSGTCDVATDIPPAPGAGPGPKQLQSPSFATWAKTLGGPVDGSFVPAIVSAARSFPDLSPSIDGRWLAAGGDKQAVFKLDDDGNVIWRTSFVTPGGRVLRVLATAPSADAGIFVLARSEDQAAFVVVKLGQSGGTAWARSVDLPPSCHPSPRTLTRDAGEGLVVAGTCLDAGTMWIVHMGAGGDVLRAKTFTDPDALHLEPTAATRSEGDLVVVGTLTRAAEPGDSVFVARLADDDTITASRAHLVCAERLGTHVDAAIASTNGAITVIGDSVGVGFVGRFLRDGSLAFASFPTAPQEVFGGLALNGVVELPTTGLVVSATYGTIDATGQVRSALLGLDGGGQVLWSRRYELADGRSLGWPALRATDDGGLVVAASAGSGASAPGELVAMKVFARDGFLADGGPVATTPIALTQTTCASRERSFAPVAADVAATTREGY